MARKKKTEPEECEYTEEEQRKIKELADSIGICSRNTRMTAASPRTQRNRRKKICKS